MQTNKYFDESPFAVTVCDENAVIVYMNEKSKRTFASYGGGELIGKSLLDCHNEASRERIRQLLSEGTSNAYTIEKNGIRKMIYQSPWFAAGRIAGLVELSLEIPHDMPHFKRG